jgi:PIN domain nuclease of toxin-antitoxin system
MKRLLLDTHVFLWWLSDDKQLGEQARTVIMDDQNEVYVSAVSGWEISIKREMGRLSAPDNLDALVEEAGFMHLPVTFFHGEQAGNLPVHHRDPFDRMLVAQAQAEGLTIVTGDKIITLYGVHTINANR